MSLLLLLVLAAKINLDLADGSAEVKTYNERFDLLTGPDIKYSGLLIRLETMKLGRSS